MGCGSSSDYATFVGICARDNEYDSPGYNTCVSNIVENYSAEINIMDVDNKIKKIMSEYSVRTGDKPSGYPLLKHMQYNTSFNEAFRAIIMEATQWSKTNNKDVKEWPGWIVINNLHPGMFNINQMDISFKAIINVSIQWSKTNNKDVKEWPGWIVINNLRPGWINAKQPYIEGVY